MLRWALVILAVTLAYPPTAAAPGQALGMMVRFFAARMREVGKCFLDSFYAEIGSLFTDLLEWVENCFWPIAPNPAQPHPPGQRLAAVVVGALAFRMMRPVA